MTIFRLSFYLSITLFFSCKKEYNEVNEQKPSSLSILLATKLDQNKFRILFQINTDSSYAFDNYGLAISKEAFTTLQSQNIRMISYGRLDKTSSKEVAVVVDSLEANTSYHLRIFARRSNHDYISEETIIKTSTIALVSMSPSRSEFYASRGEQVSFTTNINDSTPNTIETRIKIGGVEAKVQAETGNIISLIIPENINSGKQSIEISRNGISLIVPATLNILRGKWTAKNDFPYDFHIRSAFTQVGNFGYLIGGIGGNNGLKDFYRYDVNTDQWSNGGAPFINDILMDAVALSTNNKFYVLGGFDSIRVGEYIRSNGFYEFDPALNQWSRKARFPGDIRVRPNGFTYNNKIYIYGGHAGGGYPATDIWEYNPMNNSWKKITDFPGTSVIYSAVFPYKDKVYFFGGLFPSGVVTNEFFEYDLVANKWTQLELNRKIRERYKPTFFTMGNKGYMIGGAYPDMDQIGAIDVEIDEAWELNLDTKQWNLIGNNPVKTSTNFPFFNVHKYAFQKGNAAFIYDAGKMFQFIPE